MLALGASIAFPGTPLSLVLAGAALIAIGGVGMWFSKRPSFTDVMDSQLATVARLSVDFVAVLDLDKKPRFLNASGASMLGLTGDEQAWLADSSWADGLVTPQQFAAAVADGAWSGEDTIGAVDVIKTVAAVRADDGSVECVSVVAHDIRTLKEVDRLKHEFVSAVSHELRTPLASARGALKLISGGVAGEIPAKAAELVAMAERNTDRLTDLINDILDLDRLESRTAELVFEKLDLGSVIRSVATRLASGAAEARVRIECDVPGPLTVRADRARLEQLIEQLATNAVKFSPPDSTIHIEADVTVDDRVRLSVRDEGPGIEKDDQGRVFNRFVQLDGADDRQSGGVGLGLALAKAITVAHGGDISLRSEPGAGTTVDVELLRGRTTNEIDALRVVAKERSPPALGMALGPGSDELGAQVRVRSEHRQRRAGHQLVQAVLPTGRASGPSASAAVKKLASKSPGDAAFRLAWLAARSTKNQKGEARGRGRQERLPPLRGDPRPPLER